MTSPHSTIMTSSSFVVIRFRLIHDMAMLQMVNNEIFICIKKPEIWSLTFNKEKDLILNYEYQLNNIVPADPN